MDDPIIGLVRAAKPGTVHRTDPLSDRALDELAKYQAAEVALGAAGIAEKAKPTPTPQRRLPTRWTIGSLVTAAMMVLVVVTITTMTNLSHPAFAATPPMLETRPVTDSSSSLLKELATMRSPKSGRSDTITTHSWALNSEIGDDGQIFESNTEPELIQTVFGPDGSVRVTTKAAEPFPGQEHEGLPAAGTLLGEDFYAPGEYGLTMTDGPPDKASEIGQYLADFSGDPALTASQAIREIGNIATSLPLDPGQESALLEYLGSMDGITVVGRVADRLGREGIAFSSDDGDYRQLLVVSQATGALLAIETVYIGHDRSDIPSPAVIYYAAWGN